MDLRNWNINNRGAKSVASTPLILVEVAAVERVAVSAVVAIEAHMEITLEEAAPVVERKLLLTALT